MKSFLSRLCRTGLLMSAAIFAGAAARAQWSYLGNAGFSPGTGTGVSNWQHLVADTDNTLYVSFNDEALPNGKAVVMRYNGTAWTAVGTPGFTGSFAHHSHMALAAGDSLYFSCADGSNMSRAAVYRHDGTGWTSLGSGLSAGAAQYTQVAVAPDGTPYLGYIDMAGSTVGVLRYNGSSWVAAGTNAVSGSGCSYTSMRFDSNGVLHVAYADGSNQVIVKQLSGGTWTQVGSGFLSQSIGTPMGVSLAFDHSNRPAVAYWNPAPAGPKASVHRWNGSSWSLIGPASFTSGIVGFTSLAFGSGDTAFLAFHDQTLGTKASVMKFDGSSWVNVGAPGFTPGVAAHTSLAINGNGNLFVAFFDDAAGGRTSVMKYGQCTEPEISTIAQSSAFLCQGDTALLSLTGNLQGASQWYWYTGGCGGTLVDSGASIRVAPLDTTTYYVRGLGGCVSTGPCTPVTVMVDTMARPTISLAGQVLTSSAAGGNQWQRGGQSIGGATGVSYTVTQSGWYRTVVTGPHCTLQSDSVFVAGLGLASLPGAADVQLYPAPVQENLHIRLGSAFAHPEAWTVSLTDPAGRQLYRSALRGGEHAISMSDKPAGLYFVVLSSAQGRIALRVLHTD